MRNTVPPKEAPDMARKAQQSARAELDQRRQHTARERTNQRELTAKLEAAQSAVDDAGAAVTEAYAADDPKQVARCRTDLDSAAADPSWGAASGAAPRSCGTLAAVRGGSAAGALPVGWWCIRRAVAWSAARTSPRAGRIGSSVLRLVDGSVSGG